MSLCTLHFAICRMFLVLPPFSLCTCCFLCGEWHFPSHLDQYISRYWDVTLCRKPCWHPFYVPIEHSWVAALNMYCRCLFTNLSPFLHWKFFESRKYICSLVPKCYWHSECLSQRIVKYPEFCELCCLIIDIYTCPWSFFYSVKTDNVFRRIKSW